MKNRLGFAGWLLPCVGIATGLLVVCGCTTASSLDNVRAIQQEHLLGRRYVLTRDASLSKARFHPLFTFEKTFPQYGELPLSKGTIVLTDHVESIRTENVDYSAGANEVQAVVQTGRHKGERVSVGMVLAFNAKYAEFQPLEKTGKEEASDHEILACVPDNAPVWLDTAVVPPKVKSVGLEVLRGALHDPQWMVRYYALAELIRRDFSDTGTIEACAAAISDDVGDVRMLAINALRADGAAARVALDALVRRLSEPLVLDAEAERISDAIVVTGSAGMQRMDQLLMSSDGRIVSRGVGVLGKNGSRAGSYRPQLVEMLHHENNWASYFEYNDIYKAIREIDCGTAVSIALEALREKDATTRISAAWELSQLYGMASRAGDVQLEGEILEGLERARTIPMN